jgi:hypothetical protein
MVQKTFLDYYMECGSSAHFIALSVILFIGALCATFKRPVLFNRLLLPSSVLPIILGIYGCSSNLQRVLTNMLSSGVLDPSPWQAGAAECLQPLVFGSFLSGMFVVITLISLFILRNAIAEVADGKTPEAPPSPH